MALLIRVLLQLTDSKDTGRPAAAAAAARVCEQPGRSWIDAAAAATCSAVMPAKMETNGHRHHSSVVSEVGQHCSGSCTVGAHQAQLCSFDCERLDRTV